MGSGSWSPANGVQLLGSGSWAKRGLLGGVGGWERSELFLLLKKQSRSIVGKPEPGSPPSCKGGGSLGLSFLALSMKQSPETRRSD